MRPRIVLGSVGSLGDLYPVIGLGQALAANGADPLLAVRADHVEIVRRAGLDVHAVFDDLGQISSEMGVTPAELYRQVLEDDNMLLRDIILPRLGPMTRRFAEIADGVALVACSRQTIAGQIVAEAFQIPYVPLEFQPMMFLSPFDPPRGGGFDMTWQEPGRTGLYWNVGFMWAVRQVMRHRYRRVINAIRAEWGLAPQASMPFFEEDATTPFRLALYSPLLTRFSDKEQEGIRFCGFPFFDGATDRDTALSERDPALSAFLEAEPAPIAFTLGSFSVIGGRFFANSVNAARALGQRAILVTGGAAPSGLPTGNDILVRDYVPYSEVFPKCAAVVHHGGIGTISLALRAGVPQLVVPIGTDQPDNAARTARLGVGLCLSEKRYTVGRATEFLRRILADTTYRDTARQVAHDIALEPGPAEAARLLLAVVQNKRLSNVPEASAESIGKLRQIH